MPSLTVPPPLRPFAGPERIPKHLKQIKRWAAWRAEWDAKRGKYDKIPAGGLSTKRPQQWHPFEHALATLERSEGRLAGVGYCATNGTGLVFIDLDDCVQEDGSPTPWAAEVIARLNSYTERTPSGLGFRVVVRADVPTDWTNHERGVEVYGGHTARFLTITGDWQVGTPEDVLEPPAGVLGDLAASYAREKTKADVVDISMPDLVDDLVLPGLASLNIPESTRRFLEAGECSGDRSGALHVAGVSLYAAGLDDAEVLSVLRGSVAAWGIALDHRRQDPERALLYLWREHCVKARGKGVSARVSADEFDVAVPPLGAPSLPKFKRNKAGQIEASIGNVLMALRRPDICGRHIGHDRFNDELMLAPTGTQQWRTFTDSDYTRLREGLAAGGFREIGRELMRDAVALVASEHAFDSAQLWLRSLPAHDGVPRVQTFLARYLDAEDNAYTRASAMYLWTALAGRVLDPGCQADMAHIWIGKQGEKKTSTVAALVPSSDHFVEINLAHRDENLARSLRGKLVGELGELRGLAGREAEDIKAWISRRYEEWVPKYKEFATKFPRRLVLIGTTNADEFLGDPTGNRRWLPIRVGTADIEAIVRDREQLWAEARDLFDLIGIDWQEAERLAAPVHAEHMVSDSWADAVARWLDEDELNGEKPRTRKFMRVGDVLAGALRMDPRDVQRRDELRIGNVLRGLGFERAKVWTEGRSLWAYRLPLR